MEQSFKQTLNLIKLDLQARSQIEEKKLTAFRVFRYMFKSAHMPIVLYRWQIFFYQHHMGFFSSLLKLINNIVFTVKIDSDTEIGPGFLIYHSSYVLIGPNVRLGKNCQLANQNAIMPSSFFDGDSGRSAKGPVIGDNLLLGCGASIVGDIILGSDVRVSVNSTVDQSFPDGAVLIGVPARNLHKAELESAN